MAPAIECAAFIVSLLRDCLCLSHRELLPPKVPLFQEESAYNDGSRHKGLEILAQRETS